MNREVIRIEGMSCGHCAGRVTKSLESVAGVRSAKVDLAGKSATVEFEPPADLKTLEKAVVDAGYSVNR